MPGEFPPYVSVHHELTFQEVILSSQPLANSAPKVRNGGSAPKITSCASPTETQSSGQTVGLTGAGGCWGISGGRGVLAGGYREQVALCQTIGYQTHTIRP